MTSSISPQRSTRSPRARTLRGLPDSVGVGASFPAPPGAPRPATAAAPSGCGGRGASDMKRVGRPSPRLTLAPGQLLIENSEVWPRATSQLTARGRQ
jgi:hypothetical protein